MSSYEQEKLLCMILIASFTLSYILMKYTYDRINDVTHRYYIPVNEIDAKLLIT